MTLFRPKASVRAQNASGQDLYFYELFLAEGPATVGDTGAGDAAALFGTNWITLIDRGDLTLHAFREGPLGVWTEETTGLPSSFGMALPATVRRLSHAFDQAARIIVAWEDSGAITATRWDPGSGAYVSDVSFAGVNPCLLMQVTVDGVVGGSDIWLFYQREDAPGEVFYRLQRDSYGIEYSLFSDSSIAVLDRVVALPYRFEVWVSDAYGTPLQALVSDYYPVAASEPLAVGIAPDAVHFMTAQLPHSEAEPVTVAMMIEPIMGVYVGDTSYRSAVEPPLALTAAPGSAEFILEQLQDAETEPVAVAHTVGPGVVLYQQPVIDYAPLGPDRTTLSIAPKGADYHAV